MDTFARRRANLAAFRKEHGLTQNALATLTGRKQNQISGLETGGLSFGEKIARALEVELGLDEGALDREPASTTKSTIDSSRFVLVPRVRVEIAAGDGRVVDVEEDGAPLPFELNFIRRTGASPSNLRLIKVRGDSMAPYINNGDTVMIDVAPRDLQDGEVYAIRYGQEIRLKRLFRRVDGGLTIRSDNSTEFPDEIVPAAETEAIHVIGRKVWRAG